MSLPAFKFSSIACMSLSLSSRYCTEQPHFVNTGAGWAGQQIASQPQLTCWMSSVVGTGTCTICVGCLVAIASYTSGLSARAHSLQHSIPVL